MTFTEETNAATETLAASLRSHGVEGAEIALVLGSGLGAFADGLDGARAIPFDEIDGMPTSSVPGHAGRLVVGDVDGTRVVIQQGRVHLYEGWSVFEVTRAVRAFARLGVRGLLLTNAAGGLRPEWEPGSLMRVTDHINLQGRTPLFRGEEGVRSPYDARLGDALDRAAEAANVTLERGVYAGLSGPVYETPSEVRALAFFGADAVGMSTVAEASAGAAAGLRVAALSCITNLASGLSDTPPSHDEVVETGRAAAGRFQRLLEAAVPKLAATLAETAQ